MEIKIGADPEFFVSHMGKMVSARGLIPGTKLEPHRVKNGAVQVDGMALEININPAKTSEEFCENLSSVLQQLRNMIPRHALIIEPVAHFDEAYLKAQGEEATQLGCDPDFNAYTGDVNPTPDAAVDFRTAAGHIHIGWTSDADVQNSAHILMCTQLVKQLDLYLGVPSILWDTCVERRKLYGKAGAYRPKEYGVEYRVLSNMWLRTEHRKRWIYRRTLAAVKALEAGQLWYERIPDAEEVINNNNLRRAESIGIEMRGVSYV